MALLMLKVANSWHRLWDNLLLALATIIVCVEIINMQLSVNKTETQNVHTQFVITNVYLHQAKSKDGVFRHSECC